MIESGLMRAGTTRQAQRVRPIVMGNNTTKHSYVKYLIP